MAKTPEGWLLGTADDFAIIRYLREGDRKHQGCQVEADVEVRVLLDGATEPTISSVEKWTCDVCGLDELSVEVGHDTLTDAMLRLPAPRPGELRGEALTDDLHARMAHARREHAALPTDH